MMKFLPTGDFQWGSDDEVESYDLNEWGDEDERGCILKIDCSIPVELHDEMKWYPLPPEKMCVKEDMLSETQKNVLDSMTKKKNDGDHDDRKRAREMERVIDR